MNTKNQKPNNPPAGEAMTMRDYFAAKAMQGFASDCQWKTVQEMAQAAYVWADAMMLERSK